MKDSYRNPFSGVNAVQLTEDKILEYWCNPFRFDMFSDKISEEDIFSDPMNIALMGGRSTGKSMFLRYWSFPVQLKLSQLERITLLDKITQNHGVGFYFRIDGAKLKSFYGHNLSDEHWRALFIHYFELIVGRQYLEFLNILNSEKSISDNLLTETILPKLCEHLSFANAISLTEVLSEFDLRIKEVEVYLGNVPFYKEEFKPKERGFLSQTLSFGIPQILIATITNFESLNFTILLDEYENFLEYQQKIINTLLRFTKPQIKFRLGMRLEGFRTFEMISEDDFIKETREYRKVVFEELLNNKESGYHDFLFAIAQKRLESIPALIDKGFTNIRTILTGSEDLEIEAFELSRDNPEKVLEFCVKKFSGKTKFKISDSDIDKIRYPKNPLLEILNFIWLLRGMTADRTATAMNDYINKVKSEDGKKYRLDYVDKYKLSLTFLLCSIFRKSKQYYSFNTFAFLSSGIVGHFIELCRASFAIAGWGDNEKLLNEGFIKKEFQTKAAIDFSTSEKQQIGRIETYGGIISRFIENMGNIFRAYHLDFQMRYPETNQFAINVDGIKDYEMRNVLKAAIKWTIIQKKPKMQISGPSEKNLQDTYTINRIFSPTFQISYRTRGGKSVLLDEPLLKELMYDNKVNISKHLKDDDFQQNERTNNNKQDLFSNL